MDVINEFYSYIYLVCGENDMFVNFAGWVIILIVWYWLLSGLFMYSDVTGRPTWITRYKVQPNENQPVNKKKLLKAVKVVAFNTIFLNLVFFYPLHECQKWAGIRFSPHDTPTLLELIKHLIGILLVQEVIFYYSHRLFHHPWLYKRIHKQHHEWTAPIGLIATYSTTLEYTTGNGMSVFLGPLIMKSHILTVWVWYFLAVTGTIVHHSGYHLPLLLSPEFHDFHHLKFNYNFGTLGLLDWLHGTDGLFRQSVESTRHRTLWSTLPAWKRFPKPKTNCEVSTK